MKIRVLTLLLGSNMGVRETNLQAAETRLDAFFGSAPLARSAVMETEALGFDGPPFLNLVLCYPCRRLPETVLRRCKAIERALGREDAPLYDATGQRIYRNRPIDIDILSYGELVRNTPLLKIPHPQIESRLFVRTLLAQLPPHIGQAR
ncbi:MAG: 2-amino-4-hydroxy-6-hydroxymethyldihydropteridine diphosphokinase [Bacteroidales bacterium]|nr:2-amino-4-hydroxy-6-hydroxymethyldihydropteridine diphosphokinase [Bacteroidales bacterium]